MHAIKIYTLEKINELALVINGNTSLKSWANKARIYGVWYNIVLCIIRGTYICSKTINKCITMQNT